MTSTQYRPVVLEALQPAPNRWHPTELVKRVAKPLVAEAFDDAAFSEALGWLVERGLVETRHNTFTEGHEYRLSESGKLQQGVS